MHIQMLLRHDSFEQFAYLFTEILFIFTFSAHFVVVAVVPFHDTLNSTLWAFQYANQNFGWMHESFSYLLRKYLFIQHRYGRYFLFFLVIFLLAYRNNHYYYDIFWSACIIFHFFPFSFLWNGKWWSHWNMFFVLLDFLPPTYLPKCFEYFHVIITRTFLFFHVHCLYMKTTLSEIDCFL